MMGWRLPNQLQGASPPVPPRGSAPWGRRGNSHSTTSFITKQIFIKLREKSLKYYRPHVGVIQQIFQFYTHEIFVS